MVNQLASEQLGIVATIDPATITTVSYSDVIDMAKYDQVLGVFLLGNMDDSNDVVCGLYRCDSAGSNQSIIKTKTLTAAAGNDNTQVKIGVKRDDLLPQTTYNRYCCFGITNSGGGVCGMVAIAIDPKAGPADDHDLASVAVVNALD